MLRSFAILAALGALCGCADSPHGAASASDTGRADDPALLATVRVLAAWPDHPRLQFDMKQTSGGLNEPPPPPKPRPPVEQRQMSPEEFEAFMAELAKLPAGAVIAAPRVLALSGQEARIASAPAEEPGAAEEDAADESYELAITPRLQPDGSVSVELRYAARGFPTKEPASRFEDGDHIGTEATFTIQPGDTQFLLSHGLIGAPMHLLAITVERAP